jgi:hypothetical protein
MVRPIRSHCAWNEAEVIADCGLRLGLGRVLIRLDRWWHGSRVNLHSDPACRNPQSAVRNVIIDRLALSHPGRGLCTGYVFRIIRARSVFVCSGVVGDWGWRT